MIRVVNGANAPQLAEIYAVPFGEAHVRAVMVVVVALCRDQGLLVRSVINVRKWQILLKNSVFCPERRFSWP